MATEWNVGGVYATEYLQSCLEFVNDEYKFDHFKTDYRYKRILEHIDKNESDMLISEMKNKEIITEEHIEKFRENDLYGYPEICEYDFFGKMSPSTIRYIKNTLDIYNFVGDKKIKNIVEIGGGYGGLCKTMSVLFDFDNYVLIDLPEVNKLSNKYLSKFEDLSGRTSQYHFDEFEEIENIDLVISNYAFSECSLNIQKKYYDKVILNSQYYYMTYNNITTGNLNSDDFFEKSSKDFSILIEEEIRQIVNYLYYGTKKIK